MNPREERAKNIKDALAYAAIRKKVGVTQEQFGQMVGASRETIARRETGKDRITREAALALFGLSKLPRNQRTPDTEGS